VKEEPSFGLMVKKGKLCESVHRGERGTGEKGTASCQADGHLLA